MRWTRSRLGAGALALVSALAGAVAILPGSPAQAAALPASAEHSLEVVDLGTLPGGTGGEATAINDRGWVVGSAGVAPDLPVSHAFLWRHGRMTDLGSLSGPGGSSNAADVNERGEIVGSSSVSSGQGHAFRWHRGRMIDLGTLGGTFSLATGINDRGEIVGWSETASGQVHGFRWYRGRMVDLGVPAGSPSWTSSSAEAINNSGAIVGSAGGAVVWQGGVIRRLRLPAGADSANALDIDVHGTVAGYALYPSGAAINQAVVWRRGVPQVLGGLADGPSQALALNDRGQIVGAWQDANSFGGFLWDHGRLTKLPTLTGGGGAAHDINNHGVIVGYSPHPTDPFQTRAVLWR
jgi:probable HAF family extracellular repeat protein